MGLYQSLHTVLPDDPGLDRMTGGGRADCEPAHLLRSAGYGGLLGRVRDLQRPPVQVPSTVSMHPRTYSAVSAVV
jgi:hypothetical protein